MLRNALCLLALLVVQEASSLLVQPRMAAPAPLLRRAGVAPAMQFGKPEREGLARNEPGTFSTNMDDMTDEEKLKSPVVIGGLIILIAPFLVGAIALQFYR